MNLKLMPKYFACLLFLSSAVAAQTIVVSPDGPIQTLIQARDAARHCAILERPDQLAALRMGFQPIDVSSVSPRVPAGADVW